VLITFPVKVTKRAAKYMLAMADEFERQGFLNFLAAGKLTDVSGLAKLRDKSVKEIFVIADEIAMEERNRKRFFDSAESAMRYGKGFVSIFTSLVLTGLLFLLLVCSHW